MPKNPKLTKLHVKGTSNSIQKPCKIESGSLPEDDLDESMRQFQLELCWCIQQLERCFNDKKGSEKQMLEAWKVLTVLKNNNQPIIRKRQVMRSHFGDYRAKMAAEEKKLTKIASKMKISEVADKPKATFVRKSAFLTTGDSSFRFNFNLDAEQVDSEPNRTTEQNDIENNATNTDLPNVDSTEKTDEDEAKKFKFTFSESQFKFNFNGNEP